MADYQITCATKEYQHSHILNVGTGSQTWTVQQVYSLMDQGNTFHTGSYATGNYAAIAKDKCASCSRDTLRTHADGKWNNNLDSLRSC